MKIDDCLNLKNRILNGEDITFEEAVALSKLQDKQVLYESADEIRRHFFNNAFDLCTITNAKSGKCSENCKWCSQSAWHTTDIEIYPMVEHKRAVSEALHNASFGVHRYSLVASGRAVSDAELDSFLDIYSDIKKQSDINLCASFGLMNKQQLQRLKDGGVSQYHCNLETASSFFPNVCTTHKTEEKLQTIHWAQEVGLRVCSGGIIGMGETMDQRIELAFEIKKIGAKSIPINILNPIKGTALENQPPLSETEILTTIALFRFINPQAFLRFAGGRLLIKSFQDNALKAGINASIVGEMLTTAGIAIDQDIKEFRSAGFNV